MYEKNLRNGSFVLTKLPRMLIMMKTVLILLVCSLNLQVSSLFTTEKIRHFDEKSLFGGCVSIFEASERI